MTSLTLEASCRYEHPRDRGGFGANSNRFGVLNGGGSDSYRPGQQSASANTYNITKEILKIDLTNEKPIYPLSCYGPGRDAPRQLIEGACEISPEELRLRYYNLRDAGNESQAVCSSINLACSS